ncbi:bifunctional enoyl-CoA hydratase/phosphate acetyltransferase [Palleronia sp. KMU-117]|uniref:bifunctional enoyl-CoA hydratase/phosphate acetyltransferase n=1 Tax=Palleronia sp. KMU-117 TaxID=3434108 RepID=UPI003D7651DA
MHFDNTPFDRLTIGDTAETTRACTADDLYVFARSSGNRNPMHLPEADGDLDGVPEGIAPMLWVASLVSEVLGNKLPGPGTMYRSQTLTAHTAARVGDTLTARVTLLAKGDGRLARFSTEVLREDGTLILSGEAEVIAPDRPQSFDGSDVPDLLLRRHVHFERLLKLAEPLAPLRTAVVAPEEAKSLGGALLALSHTLIEPILLGDPARIEAAADEIGADLKGIRIIPIPENRLAAARAVALVREGRADAIMKGHLHTDVLLHPMLDSDTGLRAGRRLSHIFVMDVPGLKQLLFVTDAAINIAPDLKTKVDIVQNAIDLARALGIEEPKVGILSAVETVNFAIPSTMDAAILSKMAERGQITGGAVDGPLAMDNAVDLEAARTKGLTSVVAGKADILVAPNLEAGNMLAKELSFIAHAAAAGVVIGASCPVILNSRSDDDEARLASCAVAALYHARAKTPG